MKSFKAQHVDYVAELVERRPGATWGEVQRIMRTEGFDADGDGATGLPGNLIFAYGLSDGLIEIVHDAHQAGRLHFHRMRAEEAVLVYGYEGDPIPDLPVAKRVPANGYREPHWLPVVMYPGRGCVDNCQCPVQEN
jgi:hypothetical protein